MTEPLDSLLAEAARVATGGRPRRAEGALRVGVDLGTAYTVLLAVDETGMPVAGRAQFAQIVRDGLVVDFIGAIELVKRMKREVEADLGVTLSSAATSYPPGVPLAEVKATRNVLIAAGLDCDDFVDEPTAANALLGIDDGAVVDVGGGTTGIAIVENGRVVRTVDEPTGGTQFTLVLAGALGISFETAEAIKKDPREAERVLSLTRPVMEKVGSIVARHLVGSGVGEIHMVGGTSGMRGIGEVVAEATGLPVRVPPHPMFVTPLGIALTHRARR
ncbi:MAG: ethanolamine utilization protein EutJ [Phyllobacteriaceae bacterium]|nr:ethanolamine utilization protein EutJ [Phyllobacteriaceae bacterium]